MDAALEFCLPLRSAGFPLAGMGIGVRSAVKYERTGPCSSPTSPCGIGVSRIWTRRTVALIRVGYSIDLLALVGEVTSSNHETDTGPKYRTYAAAGVPVYVLVHRREGKAPSPIRCASRADEAHYATTVEVAFGRPLLLPERYPALQTAFLLER